MSTNTTAAPVDTLERPSRFPYITGFCSNGSHEGTKKLSLRGTLLRPCLGTFWIQGKKYECRCDCHEVFRQIAEITGVRAAEVSAPILGGFLSTQTDVSSDIRTDTPPTLTAPATGLLGVPNGAPGDPAPGAFSSRPVLVRPSANPAESFSTTPSGQRARGQLEAEVAHVVMRWFRGKTDESGIPLTPDNVRAAIKSEPPASNGAIYSVFKRWQAQGYVALAEKPFRMLHPTQSGARYLARWA